MPKTKRKYTYLWVVQGNWSYGEGWEDLTASEDYMEAFGDLNAYNQNDDAGAFRMIQRRVLND